ncbi:protein SNORC [Periophthalmus magnuspinnatus]|uniref:protein SNORC n=1 Tax=Periophthalmus magnuspinnatus TaxID=409849 RepID=UPI00145AD4CD|nr:protein SNORC [Periophthalmus magnuspinnatus]
MVPRNAICRMVLLMLLGFLVNLVNTETLDPGLTSQDSQDTSGDDLPTEVTTKDTFHETTGLPATDDYEDTTHNQTVEEEEDSLGPGAITAIVIATFLGASVLLALIVIALRKFTAS